MSKIGDFVPITRAENARRSCATMKNKPPGFNNASASLVIFTGSQTCSIT